MSIINQNEVAKTLQMQNAFQLILANTQCDMHSLT